MATFLLKTEPSDYSWDDLARDKRTHWDGVTNAAAQKHMRSIKKGDEVLFYHTGNDKCVVGLATVVKGAYPDPTKPGTTAAGDTKFVLVDIAPVKASATDAATLAAIKADARISQFDLVRQGRLSAMPVPASFDKHIRKMAGL